MSQFSDESGRPQEMRLVRKPKIREKEFRAIVRRLIERGEHPSNVLVRRAMWPDTPGLWPRSGLSVEHTRWRVDEMERAGFDWEASKKARRLVPKQTRAGVENPR